MTLQPVHHWRASPQREHLISPPCALSGCSPRTDSGTKVAASSGIGQEAAGFARDFERTVEDEVAVWQDVCAHFYLCDMEYGSCSVSLAI